VLSFVGSGIVTGRSPVQGILQSVYKTYFQINSEREQARGPNRPNEEGAEKEEYSILFIGYNYHKV
jgi:hypothetical protein